MDSFFVHAFHWAHFCKSNPFLRAGSRLDPSKTYVIGGLVDRIQQKGASAEAAAKIGAPSFRLPIREYLNSNLPNFRDAACRERVAISAAKDGGSDGEDGGYCGKVNITRQHKQRGGVLNINTVVDILAHFHSTGDMHCAMQKVIPKSTVMPVDEGQNA